MLPYAVCVVVFSVIEHGEMNMTITQQISRTWPRKATVRVLSVPAGEYLTAGETYEATQARSGHDWRFTGSNGGTFVRWYTFKQAMRAGQFEITTLTA